MHTSRTAKPSGSRIERRTIESWSEFVDIVEGWLGFRNWAFRGQGDARWPLRSALSRHIEVSKVCREAWPRQDATAIRGTLSPELPTPLSPRLVRQFSWSKLQELIRVDDPLKRAFYENECLKSNWSVRQLQRQIGSLLFERTGLSTNKAAVLKRARRQEAQQTIEDLIRDPYVLEFTGLGELPQYTGDAQLRRSDMFIEKNNH